MPLELLQTKAGISTSLAPPCLGHSIPDPGSWTADLLANNQPRRPPAFPNFERDINFHVAYFLSSSSAKVASSPPGLEESHFSFFPWSTGTTVTAALSSSLSWTTTPSSRSNTVCSSVSSSPTLSSISTPGRYFIDDETVGKSMMSHRYILEVCAALVQTIESTRANQQHRSMSSRTAGVIGGHLSPKTWSFAEVEISCLLSGIDTPVALFVGSQL